MSDRSVSRDREIEMVLDNKKLFSILFLTFVLLGVFFAMGYVLGRSSATAETVPPSGPVQASAPAPRPSAAGDMEDTAQRESAPPDSDTSKGTEPAGGTSAGRPSAEPEAAPPAGTIIEPKPGQTFLQVSAVARPEAELLVDVLIRKGFRAVVAPGPNENLYRVLVGPAADDTELARIKGDLEQAGFKPIPRRY
jgi:cell division septation protein DedD